MSTAPEPVLVVDLSSDTELLFYPYPEWGSYYAVEGDTLIQAAMLADGSMSTDDHEWSEVDFDRIDEDDVETCRRIQSEVRERTRTFQRSQALCPRPFHHFNERKES